MTKPTQVDPLDELSRADPIDADGIDRAVLARIRQRSQAAVTSRTEETQATRRDTRRWPPARAVSMSAVAVAVVALLVLNGSDRRLPGVLPEPDPSGGPVTALCVETYDLDTLRDRDFAFDGTVQALAGDSVTFMVNESYRGLDSASVTLSAVGMAGTTITSAGGPSITQGQRYLIAGDDGFVWACGFSQPYQPEIAARWARALTE